MFSTSDVEPLLGVESNALGNGWEVTAKLSEDVAELRVAVSFLHHSQVNEAVSGITCLLYTSPSPRDATLSRMPSSA